MKFGGNRIWVQSMLNRRSDDLQGNIQQAIQLEKAGCDILRVAIPNFESIRLIDGIKNAVDIPLVADIHFNYKLALEAVAAGIDKVRINPGNIGDESRVREVALTCQRANIPIRIGVNGGSLEKEIHQKYGGITPDAMVQSALYHVKLLEKFDFDDIVISLKSSDIVQTMQAYRLMAQKCDYPFHLGITEAGTERMGLIRSTIGIGGLLAEGLGDTIRVSLTGEPLEEIYAGIDILKSLSLYPNTITIISCPTCGRTRIDLISLAKEIEEKTKNIQYPLKVAVMGCAVNGPGEAKDADIGIAGGDGCGLLFKKGEIIKKVEENQIISALVEEINKIVLEGNERIQDEK